MSANEEYYTARITALENELKRVNVELGRFKDLAFKTRLTDPNFDKPISDLEVKYEIVKSN